MNLLIAAPAAHSDDSLRKPVRWVRGSVHTLPTVDLDARTLIGPAEHRADTAAEGNARRTAANAAVLLALLAAEGFTLLGVRQMLTPHVFIGMVLIPPVLRLLGPVVVVLTVVPLASGVALLFVRGPDLSLLFKVHKASFILWFGAMTIRVLGHMAGVLVLSRTGPWLAVSGQ